MAFPASPVIVPQYCSTKQKVALPLFEESARKRAIAPDLSALSWHSSDVLSLEVDTTELKEHITLAALKARRTEIALRKRQSPRKFELAVADSEELTEEVCSLSSKSGMAMGPMPPPMDQ